MRPGLAPLTSPRPPAGGARRWLLLVALLLGGCESEEPVPGIAVAAGGTFVAAAALGIEDGLAAHPGLRLDTVFVTEATNQAAAALAVAGGLASRPGLVAVIGHAGSSASLVAAPLYTDAGILQLAPTSSAPAYTRAGPLSFSMVPNDEEQGPTLSALLVEAAGSRGRVAILYVNDDYGRGLRSAVLPALARVGMQVVLDLPHADGSVAPIDVEGTVELLVRSEASVLGFLGRAPVLADLLPELRARLGAIPVIGPDGVGLAVGTEGWPPGPEWDGVRWIDFVTDRGTPELDRFRARFAQALEGREARGSEVLTYDAARLLVEGIARGARTGEELATWLRSLGPDDPVFAVLLAGPAPFDEDGNVRREYIVRTVYPGGTLR
jgi:branched-chain amino acid transport system substrate-binding protein